MNEKYLLIGLVPFATALSFLVHWITLTKIKNPADRLPLCRGAYLAMSFQLVLYSWIIFRLTDAAAVVSVLIPVAVTLSFAGDYFNLQFRSIAMRVKEPVFFGIICFSIAQLFYILAFFNLVELSTLMQEGYLLPIIISAPVVSAVIFRLRVYNPERPQFIMTGAFLYGLILLAMAAIAISAAIAYGGAWYIVAAGAVIFLVSDAVMGETTIFGRHPDYEYQVPWFTYLTAQGLIIFGTVLLASQA